LFIYIDEYIERTTYKKSFVGADLEALCKEAGMVAMYGIFRLRKQGRKYGYGAPSGILVTQYTHPTGAIRRIVNLRGIGG
jgi:SpoVK/Ycf46/Vps4 family AAA+-type ATPase